MHAPLPPPTHLRTCAYTLCSPPRRQVEEAARSLTRLRHAAEEEELQAQLRALHSQISEVQEARWV